MSDLIGRLENPSPDKYRNYERMKEAAQALRQFEDWYSPAHMDAVQKRTIEPLVTALENISMIPDKGGDRETLECAVAIARRALAEQNNSSNDDGS